MDIQHRLTKYMDELEKALSTSAEFAAKEAPLVVQEFLEWEFWSSVMAATGCLLFVIAFLVSVYRNRKFFADNFELAPLLVIPGIVVILAAVCVCERTARAAKVSIAPRLVLLEKVSELAHGKSK